MKNNQPLILHFDGAVESNKGQKAKIGCGFAIWEPSTVADLLDKEIFNGCGSSAKLATSNVAEWTALMYSLAVCLSEFPDRTFRVYGDSQLIINQFNREFAVKNKDFAPYAEMCHWLADKMGGRLLSVEWVSREHPKQRRADVLSKQGLKK